MHPHPTMGTPETITLFLLLASFTIIVSSAAELCFSSTCRENEPLIRFPFRLNNIQPNQCAFPGFDLICDSPLNKTTINLPYSGKFIVQNINYDNQEIWLNDPNNCLPQRLLNLNLSTSPFTGVYYQDYTLFNCSSSFDYRLYRFNPISCLGDFGYMVIATSSVRAVRILSVSCGLISSIPVPVPWSYFEQVWSSDLSEDIRLGWFEPQCRRCESRDGLCGLKSNSTSQIECKKQRHELPKTARYIISVGVGVPAFLFVIGLVIFICSRVRALRRSSPEVVEFTATVTPQPTIISGLDGPTIESYPKIVLGQSQRMPKPEDNICPICLSEYRPMDTLRTIPSCQHCYHVGCIDEWLRLNASCPVCRNSPKHSPFIQNP